MAPTADTLLLFGATGDLAQRMLLPSLLRCMPIGSCRQNLQSSVRPAATWANEGFRSLAEAALAKYSVGRSAFAGLELRFSEASPLLPPWTYRILESFGALSKALRNGGTQTPRNLAFHRAVAVQAGHRRASVGGIDRGKGAHRA